MAAIDVQRVIDVAATLFAEHGYDGVAIRDIASASGATSASIFYHFSSKEALYNEVTSHKYEDTHEKATRAIVQHSSPSDKVRALVETFYDIFLLDRSLFLLLQRDMIRGMGSSAPSIVRDQHIYFVSLFQRLLTDALARPADRREAFSLVSLLLGYCELTALLSPKDPKEDAHYAEQKDFLLQMVERLFFR